jgi:PKD repeat protein
MMNRWFALLIIIAVGLAVFSTAFAAEQSLTVYAVINPLDPPVADFIAVPEEGTAPLAVGLYDLSSNDPSSWEWDFESDGTIDSTLQNPTHVFSSPGTYLVRLVVSNPGGSDIITRSVTVNPSSSGGGSGTTPGGGEEPGDEPGGGSGTTPGGGEEPGDEPGGGSGTTPGGGEEPGDEPGGGSGTTPGGGEEPGDEPGGGSGTTPGGGEEPGDETGGDSGAPAETPESPSGETTPPEGDSGTEGGEEGDEGGTSPEPSETPAGEFVPGGDSDVDAGDQDTSAGGDDGGATPGETSDIGSGDEALPRGAASPAGDAGEQPSGEVSGTSPAEDEVVDGSKETDEERTGQEGEVPPSGVEHPSAGEGIAEQGTSPETPLDAVRDAFESVINSETYQEVKELFSEVAQQYPSISPFADVVPERACPLCAVGVGIGVAAAGGLLQGLAAASGGGISNLISDYVPNIISQKIPELLGVSRDTILKMPGIRNLGIRKFDLLSSRYTGSSVRLSFVHRSLSHLWAKLSEFVRKYLLFHSMGHIGSKEVRRRGLLPVLRETFLFGFSRREFIIAVLTTVIYSVAFISAGRLNIQIINLMLFLVMGALAVILHEMITDYFARKNGIVAEFQFWGLGTGILLVNSLLFGLAFGKPSRTLLEGVSGLKQREAVALMLIGPLVNIIFAMLSLLLIPFGGILGTAGSIGFSINILLSIYALIPVKPMKGRVIYDWNRGIWAFFFLPLVTLYVLVYLLPCC